LFAFERGRLRSLEHERKLACARLSRRERVS